MGDITRGKELFKKLCAECHTINRGGQRLTGPNLFGIFGRTCGCKSSTEGFQYENPMMKDKDSGVWTEAKLDVYLEDPKKNVTGPRMFKGVKDPTDRKDIIAYLKMMRSGPGPENPV